MARVGVPRTNPWEADRAACLLSQTSVPISAFKIAKKLSAAALS
ncbi:hypothetical protein HEB94_004968 [Actinopolymorpha pittospori]|uniref:Uncharacterized protein n=1 Tax=Actinopolymorpha pittospori TaxID=648752 RepID=A0A927MWC0_9ACTN|nr:hypothetical protein [Actinopolymorpha pittospori]